MISFSEIRILIFSYKLTPITDLPDPTQTPSSLIDITKEGLLYFSFNFPEIIPITP